MSDKKILADSPQHVIDEILDLVSIRDSAETEVVIPSQEYKAPSERVLFATLIGSIAPLVLDAVYKKAPEIHQVINPFITKMGFSENSLDIFCFSMAGLGVAFYGLLASKELKQAFRENAFEKTTSQQCDVEIFKTAKENNIQEQLHKYQTTAELSLPEDQRDTLSNYDFDAHYGFTPE